MHDGQPPHSNAWPLRSWGPLVWRVGPAGSGRRALPDATVLTPCVGIPLEPLCQNLWHKFRMYQGCLALVSIQLVHRQVFWRIT